MINGGFDYEELKRAALIDDPLLVKILNRLQVEGVVTNRD